MMRTEIIATKTATDMQRAGVLFLLAQVLFESVFGGMAQFIGQGTARLLTIMLIQYGDRVDRAISVLLSFRRVLAA